MHGGNNSKWVIRSHYANGRWSGHLELLLALVSKGIENGRACTLYGSEGSARSHVGLGNGRACTLHGSEGSASSHVGLGNRHNDGSTLITDDVLTRQLCELAPQYESMASTIKYFACSSSSINNSFYFRNKWKIRRVYLKRPNNKFQQRNKS